MYNCIHLLCSEIKETLQKAYPDSKDETGNIANLCPLFFNLRKGRLHYIHPVVVGYDFLLFLFLLRFSFPPQEIYFPFPNIFFSFLLIHSKNQNFFFSSKKYIFLLQIFSASSKNQEYNERFVLFTWSCHLLLTSTKSTVLEKSESGAVIRIK